MNKSDFHDDRFRCSRKVGGVEIILRFEKEKKKRESKKKKKKKTTFKIFAATTSITSHKFTRGYSVKNTINPIIPDKRSLGVYCYGNNTYHEGYKNSALETGKRKPVLNSL